MAAEGTIKGSKHQCYFDLTMSLLLSEVSSSDYLASKGILRMNDDAPNWEQFSKQLGNQTIKPGLYPKDLGDGSCHYYAVREEPLSGIKVAGNGYPSLGDGLSPSYAIGLNTQKDASHGLCQTFALMYHNYHDSILLRARPTPPLTPEIMADENLLNDYLTENAKYEPDNEMIYFHNVIIGLMYLKRFTKKDEWGWDFDSKEFDELIRLLIGDFDCSGNVSDYKNFIKEFISRKRVGLLTLHDLTTILLNKKLEQQLITWNDSRLFDVYITDAQRKKYQSHVSRIRGI